MRLANIINKTTSVDADTGEIYYERQWKSFNGWNDEGYKYRYRYNSLKFYPDMLPRVDPNILKVFFMICCITNEDNLLAYKTKSRSKYKKPELHIYTTEEIWEHLPYKISKYSFKNAWSKLVPRYIRKIKVEDKRIWAVNPAYANRCSTVPLFLFSAFKDDMKEKLGTFNYKRYCDMELNDGLGE